MISPRSTLRRVYTTPPWQSPLHCSCPVFDCGSFEVQKQSVSNAFQYVVLRPAAPHTSICILAHHGQIAFAKIQLICENATKKASYLRNLPLYGYKRSPISLTDSSRIPITLASLRIIDYLYCTCPALVRVTCRVSPIWLPI